MLNILFLFPGLQKPAQDSNWSNYCSRIHEKTLKLVCKVKMNLYHKRNMDRRN